MTREGTIADIASELSSAQDQLENLKKTVQNLAGALAHFQSLEEENTQRQRTSSDLNHRLFAILTGLGRPTHRKDIYTLVQQEKGVHINGNDPINNMTAHMSNDPRFMSFGEGKWGLTAWRTRPRITGPRLRRPHLLSEVVTAGSEAVTADG